MYSEQEPVSDQSSVTEMIDKAEAAYKTYLMESGISLSHKMNDLDKKMDKLSLSIWVSLFLCFFTLLLAHFFSK